MWNAHLDSCRQVHKLSKGVNGDAERRETRDHRPTAGEDSANDQTDHEGQPDYGGAYSRKSFRGKVAAFAPAAGKEVIRKALTLYRCLRDPDTPKWARARIIGALGYFIFPLDAIPDVVPLTGFSDDLGVLALALATVAFHVKPEHKRQAEEKLAGWFP